MSLRSLSNLDFVTIACIVKTRGIRGEVVADLLTDFPSRFSLLSEVRIWNSERPLWEKLDEYWFQKGRVVLKFVGRDCPEDVRELLGGEVQVPEGERVSLPGDAYYHYDLVGCQILENDRNLGTVTEIFETGSAGSNLVVRSRKGKEFMIPMVRVFIRAIDTEKATIRVQLPPGLVEGF